MYKIELYLCALGTHTYTCFKVVTFSPKTANLPSLYFTTLEVWKMFDGSRETENLINAWFKIAEPRLNHWNYEGSFYSCLSEHQLADLLVWLVQMRHKPAEEMLRNLSLSHLAAR